MSAQTERRKNCWNLRVQGSLKMVLFGLQELVMHVFTSLSDTSATFLYEHLTFFKRSYKE